MEASFKEIKFTDADVINADDFIPAGEYNPHKVRPWLLHEVRPWLLHDAGFTVAVVFAACEQDAMDEAVDTGKLDHLQIHPEYDNDRADYMTTDPAGFDPNCPDYMSQDGTKYWWKVEPTFLGNAGEPFDIENLGIVELPNPKFSFVALFNAQEDV